MKKIDLLKAVEQYKERSEQIAMLKNQQDALADCIKQVVGEAEELLVGPYMIRYKTVVSNRFDTTSFKKVHADIYADFLKESTSRRFTIA